MDTLLEMTRELAYELQNDGRFIRTQMAESAADEDADLQEMIGEFNLKRMAMGTEMAKENKDEEKLESMDGEIRELYARMMSNKHMAAYQQAKSELDKLVKNMVTILTMSAQGQDPDQVEDSGCGGGCDSCAGCH